MGNCWARFRKRKKKNKIGPAPQIRERKDRDISEVLSLGSASLSNTSISINGELKMIEELNMPDEDTTHVSLETVDMEKEKDIMDEIKVEAPSQTIQKPVFFQVDFVQGMRSMPPRLASRMEHRKTEQLKLGTLKLTDEDEQLMDEIMEEFETQEKLKKLRDQLAAADLMRKQHLENIREKARGMASRPPTRAGGHHCGGERG